MNEIYSLFLTMETIRVNNQLDTLFNVLISLLCIKKVRQVGY